ncbi:heparinase II/III family protein [Flammeovirgaceae bacterium 311]|nr:heparinase II/III family protein [Flammeovirgaceae bacterium 311]
MNKLLLAIVIVLCLMMHQAPAQKPVDKISYTLYNDFETGELFGWEPYPYAQDIGFDALYFARESPTYNNSRYALARAVRANDAVELSQGFTKRLNLWTTSETSIRAAVYFQSDRDPELLELTLGTFDGRRYRHTIRSPKANQWLELDIPLEAFRLEEQPLAPGAHIQVVTLEASYPVVYNLYTYTMLLDDFRISGERQRRFESLNPVSSDFEMFDLSILNKHYYYGDELSLRVIPEGDIPLLQLSGTLVDGSGKVVKNHIRFSKSGQGWSNSAIYRPRKSDARGQWEIRLRGQTRQGTEVRWAFRFLMPGKPVNEHPRLFFSAGELQERLANEKSAVARKILDNALQNTDFMEVDIDAIEEGEDRTAENLVGGPYSKNAVGFNAYGAWSSPIRRLGNVVREGSFNYAFTGDREAGEKAKKALLKLCAFKNWNAAWMLERQFWTYYPVGYTLLPVAYGYDMLYDLLTEEERKMVREAIMEKGLKLFHRDMVVMNRMPSNLTNHIAVLAGGHGMAATAIYGDDPENPYMEPYLSGIITKAKTFIDRTYYSDGSYGEPKSGYMNMATKEIALLLHTFERNFGIDWATTTDVENYYKYPLQAMHSSGLMADFGDGGHAFKGFTESHSEYFVNRTGNPFLYHYLKPHWEEGKGGYLGYLWYRDDITPVSRKVLPTSKVFEAQGMVMRSGWEDSSTVISIRLGPHSNHYHFDQGSFQLMTNGEELLIDPGIGAGGYYANPDFNPYNIQAIAHNVMLVDHDAESQNPAHFDNEIAALQDWPRMVHTFAGEIADAVEGDLANVYKNKLNRYSRTFLYTKSGPLFLFDQVESKSANGHVYDWLFHAPEKSISYSGQRVLINRPDARLTLDIVSPEIQSGRIRDRSNDKESFVTLSSAPNLTEVNFLAVLLPVPKTGADSMEPAPVTSRIEAPGWLGARVEQTGNTDLGVFRINDNAAAQVEGYATDAKRFTASTDGAGKLYKIYFEGSSFSGHGLSVHSSAPAAFAVALNQEGARVEVKSAQANRITINSGKVFSKVLLNGSSTRSWRKDSRTNALTIEVPAGMNTYTLQ